jgi:hypothetical protein
MQIGDNAIHVLVKVSVVSVSTIFYLGCLREYTGHSSRDNRKLGPRPPSMQNHTAEKPDHAQG